MVSNATTQFMMQSYDNAIKNNALVGIGENLKDFGKNINDATNDYVKREQLLEDTKRQQIANQFAIDSYDDKLKELDLSNQLAEQNVRYRGLEGDLKEKDIIHRGFETESLKEKITNQQLMNTAARMENEVTKDTLESRKGAINARNYLSTAQDNYGRELTNLQNDSIRYKSILVRDTNGKLRNATPEEIANDGIRKYKDVEGKFSYNQHEAMAANENNKQVAINRSSVTQGEGKGFQNELASRNLSQQQLAMQNESAQKRNENDVYFRNTIDQALASGQISEFEKYNNKTLKIIDGNGNVQEIPNVYHSSYYNQNINNPYGQTYNVNMDADVKISNRQLDLNAKDIKILTDTNATEEEKQMAGYRLAQIPSVRDSIKHLVKATGSTTTLEKYGDMVKYADFNRGADILSSMLIMLPGSSKMEKEYAQRRILNDEILVKLAAQSISGTLSNQDMDLIQRAMPKMLKEDQETNQIAILNLIHNEIALYEAYFGNIPPEAWKYLHPSGYKHYTALKNNYNLLSEKFGEYKSLPTNKK